MQMNPYLSFNGPCEAAFKFYERCLAPESARFSITPASATTRSEQQVSQRFS
jgi:uncharacterized glyoxalase superfamily protein PhnB